MSKRLNVIVRWSAICVLWAVIAVSLGLSVPFHWLSLPGLFVAERANKLRREM